MRLPLLHEGPFLWADFGSGQDRPLTDFQEQER